MGLLGDIGKVFVKVADVAMDVATGPIDMVAKALPGKLGDVAKLGLGVVTGNPLLIANGVAGFASDAMSAKSGPKTELPPNQAQHACGGYASPGKNPALDSLYSELIRRIRESSCHAPQTQTQTQTQTSSSSDGIRYDSNSHLDPNYLEYQEALKTLQQNFSTFDTGARGLLGMLGGEFGPGRGAQSGLLSRAELMKIFNNPNSSPEMKKAAEFFLKHPEYFTRLEMGSGVGGKDNRISLGDIQNELNKVEADIQKYGVRPPPGHSAPATQGQAPSNHTQAAPSQQASHCGGTHATSSTNAARPTGASSSIQSVLNDPTVSMETKILAMIQDAMAGLDKEIEAAQKNMAANSGDASMQYKLQDLMERRSRMTQLLSTLSSKFNEMAKTAIQNMAKA